jgi:hypothetical protein
MPVIPWILMMRLSGSQTKVSTAYLTLQSSKNSLFAQVLWFFKSDEKPD